MHDEQMKDSFLCYAPTNESPCCDLDRHIDIP